MNQMAERKGLKYDADGGLAKSGSVHPLMFEKLNALDFFAMSYPKSLGREWVQKMIQPILEEFSRVSIEDQLATFSEHVGFQIGESLKDQKDVLVTGGGAFNSYLLECVRHYLPKSKVVVPSALVVDNKEALVFAFLGLKRVRGEVNVLASVTGASKDHSSGKIDFPVAQNNIEIAN
jgi:anhydro-N-acetylmuramic acid kinase